MIGKIIGASVGRRIAGRNEGMKGAMIGAAAPWLLRRAFTPLGIAALGIYGAKKAYDWRRARRARGEPVMPAI
jgi:hypothetical protein